MPVYRLIDEVCFPDPYDGEPDGLLAVGGDLSPERLIYAYSVGIFPWYSFKLRKEPRWYCPLDRFVIFPDEIHVSHSMRNLLNKNLYQVTWDKDFEGVINGCSKVNNRHEHYGAWLGKDMIEAFTTLHEMGLAHSVEVWTKPEAEEKPRLVGGLYGLQLRNAFFGESMFSLVPSASKLALIFLARLAQERGWHFIDCQFETPLFKSMGGRYIPYNEYMELLATPNPKI